MASPDANAEMFITLFSKNNLKNLLEFRLKFGNNIKLDGIVQTIATNCPCLESLELISHFNYHENTKLVAISQMKKLQRLKLSNLGMDPNSYILIFQDRNLENLLQLEILEISVNSDVIKVISMNCPKLKVLDLPYYNKISGLSHISQLENLKTLNLMSARGAVTEDFISLFSNVSKLKNLLELNLTCCENVNHEVINYIATACPNLESLTFFRITKKSTLISLSKLNNLKSLKICGASSDGLFSLFAKKGFGNLIELDVSRCYQINNEVMSAIAIGQWFPSYMIIT